MTDYGPNTHFVSAHSPERTARCRLEDVMARLSQIEGCGHVIKTQAWNQGSWGSVHHEADTIIRSADDIKSDLAAAWAALTAVIEGEA